MSSVKYRDKSLEEVKALVENYRESLRNLSGKPPELENLIKRIEAEKAEKEQELFKRYFGDLSASNLAHAIQILTDMQKASEPHKKNKFFAKG